MNEENSEKKKADGNAETPVAKGKSLIPETPVKHQNVHGVRKSKVDPALMTLMQHEAHKLRIFKIWMGVFLVAVVLIVAVLIVRHIEQQKAVNAYVSGQRERIAAVERKIEETYKEDDRKQLAGFTGPDGAEKRRQLEKVVMPDFGKEYECAKYALQALRLSENLMDYSIRRQDERIRAGLDERIRFYRRLIACSAPVLSDPAPFVSTAAYLDMVPIRPGTFLMGSPEVTANKMERGVGTVCERPQIRITLTKTFWIARKEVDIWQMRKLIPQFQIPKWGDYELDALHMPAGNATWDQAMLYCSKLTDLERAAGRLPDGYEYRLPTEAEWEYACRAGTDTIFYWGNDFGAEGAKYANSLDIKAAGKFNWQTSGQREWSAPDDGFAVPAPPGSFLPNPWGLYDMSGNLYEWCYDYFDPDFYKNIQGNSLARTDPVNIYPKPVPYKQFRQYDAGTFTRELPCKVIRGGGWGAPPRNLRSAARDFAPQNEPNNGIGFRPVLAPVIQNRIKN